MHPLARRADNEFARFLHECSAAGRPAPPHLCSLRLFDDFVSEQVEFRADFNDGTRRCWRVSLSEAASAYPYPGGADGFERDCRDIYRRLYEHHVMNVELERVRSRMVSPSSVWGVDLASGPDTTTIAEIPLGVAAGMMTAREVHQLQMEAVAAAFTVPPDMLAGIDVRPGAINWIGLDDMAMPYAAPPPALGTGARCHRYGGRCDCASCVTERENVAARLDAETKSFVLLNEWLSPEQARQYRDKRYFDVIGSDTGKRYRIYHGTVTNIHELDEDGAHAAWWCFQPEGDLATGDVMLAQKIALESFETEALKVANSTPAFVPVIARSVFAAAASYFGLAG